MINLDSLSSAKPINQPCEEQNDLVIMHNYYFEILAIYFSKSEEVSMELIKEFLNLRGSGVSVHLSMIFALLFFKFLF